MTTTDDTLVRERLELPDYKLNLIHKAENSACLAENPDDPFSREHPLWALSEEHRQEWILRGDSEARNARREAAALRQEEKAAKRELQAPKSRPVAAVVKAELTCRDCGTAIERTGGRGRPPSRCDECRAKFEDAKNDNRKAAK